MTDKGENGEQNNMEVKEMSDLLVIPEKYRHLFEKYKRPEYYSSKGDYYVIFPDFAPDDEEVSKMLREMGYTGLVAYRDPASGEWFIRLVERV